MPRKPLPILDRFWASVNKTDTCWLWTNMFSYQGYGLFKLPMPNRRNVFAHRFSYELHYGKFAKTRCVCHTCDNPACVNPAHLFLGMPLDNSKDMAEKGRAARGRQNGNNKLTEKTVMKIRLLNPVMSQRALAKRFKITQPQVGFIVRGDQWRHLSLNHDAHVIERRKHLSQHQLIEAGRHTRIK